MLRTLTALSLALFVLAFPRTAAAGEPILPPGFAVSTVLSGIEAPTVVRFAPNNRVFVATKGGLIYSYDGTNEQSRTLFADLRGEVFNGWDRGLLGLVVDPHFTTGRPYVYVAYAYDKSPNSALQPRWGDTCPSPPGPTTDGCEILGRISRLDPSGHETVLVEGFCQQYVSHTVGSLEFGPDGQLYASSGDGASFDFADYGQRKNPCGDPPGSVGDNLAPPTAQGGSLRSQSFRRPAGQPTVLNGSILRINPDTGAASAGNPATGDANRQRIVAYGFRNPFRFTFRPGTKELWIGDVGWNSFEEIDRAPDIDQVRNYGWPCYEGDARMGTYDAQDLQSCESLYAAGTVTAPYFAYSHFDTVAPDDPCPILSSAISGLHFYEGDQFPTTYRGALFFSDYARDCIWVAFKGANGLPDMSTRQTFVSQAGGPVWLTEGPDGALYYADIIHGEIRRIAAYNQAPVAKIAATPDAGVPPLTVRFDGTGSTDPEGDALRYAWDLDGDGDDDSTDPEPTFTYTHAGPVAVRLRVFDTNDHEGTTTRTITVGTPPEVTVDTSATTWAVGDTIGFSGSARDGDGDPLPASALKWSLILHHCARDNANVCHTHAIEDFVGVASGSFDAPDHEYPSYLELSLTAVDSDRLSTTRTVRLDPRTASITLASNQPGLKLSLGSETVATTFTRTVIAGSVNTIAAGSPRGFGDGVWTWTRWNDELGLTHEIVAPASGSVTYTATYTRPPRTSLAGAEDVGARTTDADPGFGAIYYMAAARNGVAWTLRLFVDATSTASRAELALYADQNTNADTRLATAIIKDPKPGAWNVARLSSPVTMAAGRPYWFALLNPPSATGTLVWRDRAGGAELAQTTADEGTAALPATWVTAEGHWTLNGHVSGGAWAEDFVEPPPTPTPTPTPTPLPTVMPTPTPTPTPRVLGEPVFPPKLVGAWGFEERAGATTGDTSGLRNTGTLQGPKRVAGRFGRGLSFDGRNDWVTVNDSPSLDLTSELTVEGWVYPTRAGSWRTLAIKESARGLAWGLYPFGSHGLPSGNASTRTERWATSASAPPLKRWSHLAVTYDGTTIRTYVNGELAGARAQSGPLVTSSQPLRFGGNAVWPEWFAGRLDEIRIYDRALTAAQIQTDMTRPVGGPTRATGGRASAGARVTRFRARRPHGSASG